MRFLVLGGSGKVGSAAARSLHAAGRTVRILTRRPDASTLPDGVERVHGDLLDPASLDRAFTGVERAAFVPPLHPEEDRVLRNGLEAAARAGVERLVLLTIHHLEELPDAVHVSGKRDAERLAGQLGLPATFVRPNNYFQNDVAVETAIRQGFYPVPLGPVGCNSVDTGDVGEAVARLLTGDDRSGQRIPVVGARPITGPEAAELWGTALGREVVYAGGDLDRWAEQTRAHLPGWLVESLVRMYRHVAEHGLPASDAEVAATAELLGRPARRYEDFIAGRVDG